MVARVSDVLSAFTHRDPSLSIREIARRTGLPQATAWRIANDLADHGFLERHESGLSLGLRFFELGEIAARPRSLRRLTRTQMELLRHESGLTVHLAVIDGADVVYIEILPARMPLRLPSRVGGRVPAHATAVGKALLAFGPKELTGAVLAKGLPELGPGTITDPNSLQADLALVRNRGVAVDHEESLAGLYCVAAPLAIGRKEPFAAISVSGAKENFDVAKAAEALRGAVDRLNHDAALLPVSARVL